VLPAGIGGADPGIVVAEADITTGDRIFAFSDGLGDLLSAQDVSSRYLRDPSVLSHGEHCQVIRHLVDAAVLKAPNGDDITWALWEVPGQADPMRPGETGLVLTGKLMAGLEASFRLDPRVHAPRDLLPSVLSLLLAFQVSHAQTQLFGMLLAEALTNAVEHGLLNLDSSIKAQGFEAYEQHRLLALAGLESGGVRFTITLFHEEGSAGHAIRLLQAEVEDSGPGFKWSDWIPIRSDDGHRPFGRGIALLSALAKDLEYNEAGNRLRFSLECP
jgi:anti-sigma regulatory factor (Ser/Thr protein kinase)